MIYNYYFELIALLILVIMLFDCRSKMKIYKTDAVLFQTLILIALLECLSNCISSVLIGMSEMVPVTVNIAAAAVFFVLQASTIYALALFSFSYMNPRFSMRDWGFYMISAVYIMNLLLSVTSPWTRFYFYFDENGRYIQGYGTNLGYYFYYINILCCLIYVIYHRKRLDKSDKKVAFWTAVAISIGVTLQFYFRAILTIDIAAALAVLYLYMTLENPNDYQDKLTYCANEYAYKVYMDKKCRKDKLFSVIFLDLKQFRYVNSIYGTDAGDLCLLKVSQFLKKFFKKDVVFRLYQDLFAIVIEKPQEWLTSCVQEISEKFDARWEMPDGTRIKLDPIIVVCEYPTYFKSETELLKLRTYMIRKLKESHNQSKMYVDEATAQRCIRQERIEHIVRNSLQKNTLEVFYQPIVDSRCGQIVALEALSRMHNTELVTIGPDEFIPIAESTGQIIRLGFYVMEKVCTFAEEKLLSMPDCTVRCINVNLSTLQCAYPTLKYHFKEIMERHHIPAAMINLELTESTMLETPELVRNTMNELISYGARFALDDYGTGYSNISYLIQFPFQKIKFDKNFVWSYFQNAEAQMIMENEFATLHKLKKEIIVEGIETKEQYEKMKALNIYLFQGYFFSKALPEDECIVFIKNFVLSEGSS